MKLDTGSTVGEYRVLQTLGSGGAGRVYKVEHLVTGRLEAMKVLLAGDSADGDQVKRFEREIRLQANLDHPNIAPVYNAFSHDGCLCMVMEYIEGRTLEETLAHGPPPLDRALEIAQRLLAALGHAHERGVLHRDVSPKNVMVGADGRVKLMDFGLAIDPGDTRLTVSGTPLGSYYYMSPEQVRNRGALDARTDLYSCGAVLYELAAGRRMFDYGDAFSLMEAHVQEAPAPLGGIAPALWAVIARSVAKKPVDRYASAEEFAEALATATMRPARRHWPKPAFAGAFAVCLVVLALIPMTHRPPSTRPAPIEPAAVVKHAIELPPTLEPARPVEDILPEPRRRKPTAKRAADPPPRPRPLLARKAAIAAAIRNRPESQSLPEPPPVGNTKPDAEPPEALEKPNLQGPIEQRPGRLGRIVGRAKSLNPVRIFQKEK